MRVGNGAMAAVAIDAYEGPQWGSSRPQRWQGEESCRRGDREPPAEPRRHFGNVTRTRTRRSTPGGTDRLRRLARALRPTDPARRAAVLDALAQMIAAARAAGVPLIYTTPVSPADGAGSRHPATIAAFAE